MSPGLYVTAQSPREILLLMEVIGVGAASAAGVYYWCHVLFRGEVSEMAIIPEYWRRVL